MPDDGRRALRVFFITEDDPLYVVLFFETFLREYPADELDIVGMTVEDAFHEPLLATGRRVLRMYGARRFPRLLARFASAKLRRRSIGALARAQGIPLLATQSVNEPAYVERLRALDLDVLVSVAAPEIFKPPLLGVPRLACVNIHSGRLPRYRGMMPVFWQMAHGEPHVTVTIHEMVPKLDAGPVLATLDCPVAPSDSLDRVMTETKHAGARLMIDVLRRLARDDVRREALDLTEAEYFSFPRAEDVALFHSRGHRMF